MFFHKREVEACTKRIFKLEQENTRLRDVICQRTDEVYRWRSLYESATKEKDLSKDPT